MGGIVLLRLVKHPAHLLHRTARHFNKHLYRECYQKIEVFFYPFNRDYIRQQKRIKMGKKSKRTRTKQTKEEKKKIKDNIRNDFALHWYSNVNYLSKKGYQHPNRLKTHTTFHPVELD